MPVSQIDWPVDNFDRIDRFTDPYLDRWNRTSVRATEPFFKDESTYLQWNADPFYYGNFLYNIINYYHYELENSCHILMPRAICLTV